MAHITAQLIATLIRSNTDAHLAGVKSRAEWEREQTRLWKQAEQRKCALAVAKLVAPSLGGGR